MESCLYTGHVGHRRMAPVFHELRYNLFMLYLDLGELEHVFDDHRLWSVERFNWATFRRSDHMRRPGPLDRAVREEVEQQLGFRPAGPVRILTHLRYLGYCFNPISIYYCYGDDDKTLQAIVAEVHNTPWGEEYVRALDVRGGPEDGPWYVHEQDKEFHVSPFMPMDIHYRWRFSAPGSALAVQMENEHRGRKLFEARLLLERRPMTRTTLTRALLRWPIMTGKVIGAIYWQALHLLYKGVPFHPHPVELQSHTGTMAP